MERSLNQRYKDSKTTLSYKEWRKREDEKQASFDGYKFPEIPKVKKVNIEDSVVYQQAKEKFKESDDLKTDLSKKKVFGINKWVLISATVIVLGAVGYKIYKNRQA